MTGAELEALRLELQDAQRLEMELQIRAQSLREEYAQKDEECQAKLHIPIKDILTYQQGIKSRLEDTLRRFHEATGKVRQFVSNPPGNNQPSPTGAPGTGQ